MDFVRADSLAESEREEARRRREIERLILCCEYKELTKIRGRKQKHASSVGGSHRVSLRCSGLQLWLQILTSSRSQLRVHLGMRILKHALLHLDT
jgi:hypothetical protein